MLTVGVDAHKRTHTAVAVDEVGREVAGWQGANSPEGWRQVLEWVSGLAGARRWGIEGAWNYGRGLAQYLVGTGELVYDVNPRLTAESRRRARKTDKNDHRDALAVAMLMSREADELPAVFGEDETAVLELLSTEREDAIAEATRLRNKIHGLLLRIDPGYRSRLPTLTSKAGVRALEEYRAVDDERLQQQQAAMVRRLAQRLRLALEQAEELGEEIESKAKERYSPLTKLCGVSLLTAGALAGILGPGLRFENDAQLAAHAGVAPLEASSAGSVRHRLNRGGNRRLNAILYRIVLTQARCSPEAKAYLARRMTEGKSRAEAVRALKRYIVRSIWRLWRECQRAEERMPAAA
ncbi:MAG: IS110 family transposase [Chloroflexota bacterium]|nr:IS110 family transposase [Chloroflexota bacterium]